MPFQYGHTAHGVNLTNYRLLAQATEKKAGNSYRTPAEWHQETRDHVGLSSTEQKQSTTLRNTSNMLQVQAADLVVSDLTTVEAALRSKIAHTDNLKISLERSLADVESEIAACGMLKAQLETRLYKVEAKAALNSGRLQVRDARPQRERTMDDVERTLLQQKQLISSFGEKVKRAIAHVDKEIAQLETVKAKLIADLKDKIDAIEVDTAVMGVGPQGEVDSMPNVPKKNHDCNPKTPHTWARSTEENLNLARHWLADSARLRKAIRHAMQNARGMEHDASHVLNNTLLSKLNSTEKLKDNLSVQLQKVRDETVKASAQRQKLAAALEAKRGPLAQAKERFAMRKSRPCRETVQDDVEAALSREIAHLNAVTSQLSDKVVSVDKELDALALASAMLEDNLRDKETALLLDERCVLLDGRINVATAPPSSIASVPLSTGSTARSATLRRIADLETELNTARREREVLEASVGQLRHTLGVDHCIPSHTMLSPAATRSF